MDHRKEIEKVQQIFSFFFTLRMFSFFAKGSTQQLISQVKNVAAQRQTLIRETRAASSVDVNRVSKRTSALTRAQG